MALGNGLHFNNLRGDLLGGLTAAVVALPLALAMGAASGAGIRSHRAYDGGNGHAVYPLACFPMTPARAWCWPLPWRTSRPGGKRHYPAIHAALQEDVRGLSVLDEQPVVN